MPPTDGDELSVVSLQWIGALLAVLDQRLARIEERVSNGEAEFQKEWFTVPEAAKLLGKRPFTIREHCRNRRLSARKRRCGRGRTSEWVISRTEIQRYLNDGLLAAT